MAPQPSSGAAHGRSLPPGQVVGGFPPATITPPSVAGVAASGATLTATPGAYGGATAVTGQWQRNGVAIAGATGASYTVQATDGPNIAYSETATNGQGATTQRALAPYLGQVANRCFVPDTNATANKQMMSRSPHLAGDTLTQLKLYIPNWYWDRTGGTKTELGSGGNQTWTASVEYPAGTFTQVKFAGSASGTVTTFNTLVSDLVSVSIPKGATFWIRAYCVAATAITFCGAYTSGSISYSPCDLANGQALTYGASVADQTMGGAVSNTATSNFPAWTPLAIAAPTTVASVAIFGDSREHGTGDSFDGAVTGLGGTARQLDALGVPWIDVGCHGDIMATAASNFARRKGLATVTSHATSEGGINDITVNGVNPLSSLQTIWGLLPAGVPVFAKTVQPVSASTDGWATTANQTKNANDALRVSLNASLRGVAAGLSGCFEDADIVETARDSGLWKPGCTVDGTHANPSGYALLRSQSPLTPAALAR